MDLNEESKKNIKLCLQTFQKKGDAVGNHVNNSGKGALMKSMSLHKCNFHKTFFHCVPDVKNGPLYFSFPFSALFLHV